MFTSSLEIRVANRIDVVLECLEKDISKNLWGYQFNFGNNTISFYMYRNNNIIEIKSRVFKNRKDQEFEGEAVASYEVSRVTDIADDESYNHSIIKFTYNIDHLRYEKIAYLFLARLGNALAFDSYWVNGMNTILEEIQAEIAKDKENSGMSQSQRYNATTEHGGFTEWKKDEKRRMVWRAWTDEPLQPSNTQAARVGAIALPKIKDPTLERYWNTLKDNPSITDKDLAQKMGVSRQTANKRRRTLEEMDYRVRVSRQKK